MDLSEGKGGTTGSRGRGATGRGGTSRGEGGFSGLRGSVGECEDGPLESWGDMSELTRGWSSERRTVYLAVNVLFLHAWYEVHQIITGSSSMGRLDHYMWFEAKFLSLERPRSLDSCDRIGQSAVLSEFISFGSRYDREDDIPCQRGHHRR